MRLKIFSAYALACLIWGSTWMAIKASLYSLTPLVSAGYRFTLAAALVYGFTKLKKAPIAADRTAIIVYAMLGLFSFYIPFGLVYWGEQYVPSGLAAVLFAVFPFFVAVFSHFAIPNERIGVYRVAGMIIGFIGIIIIFSDSFGGDITSYTQGMIAIFISAIIQASMVVMVKKYGQHLNPLSMNFIPMLIAGFLFLLSGYIIEDTSNLIFDTNAYVSVIYLALFGSLVTFTAYYWLLKKVNIVMLALMAFITPIIALFVGWIFFNETLMLQHYIGGGFVLTGIVIANFKNILKLRKEKIVVGV